MPARTENGCLWITHSKYHYQWIGSLPFAPFVYWNVVTDDDIIPVCTFGYKNLKSAQQQIKKCIVDVKEYRLLHIESEEDHDVERFKWAAMCVTLSKENPNPYM
jgi:hypothetical protein